MFFIYLISSKKKFIIINALYTHMRIQEVFLTLY